jgi:hypothetical protein
MSDDLAARQYDALVRLNDELMSMLHAHPLRADTVASTTVREWLRELAAIVDEGLGKPSPSR